jgi:hypothetical protein
MLPKDAQAVSARLRGCMLTAFSSDYASPSAQTDAGAVLSIGSLIHTAIAPADGHTVLIQFGLARRNRGIPIAAPEGFSFEAKSIAGLRKISLAFNMNFNGWNPASAADVLVDARLAYRLAAR